MLAIGSASQFYLLGQTYHLEQTNGHPGEVDFPPFEAVAGRILVGVVVVVPAFSVGDHSHPPAVGRFVVG